MPPHVAVVAVGQPRACGAILIIGQFRCWRWPGAWDSSSWQPVRWREDTKGAMQSRFALLEVRVAHGDYLRVEPRVPELLLIEWPSLESEPNPLLALYSAPAGVAHGVGPVGQNPRAHRARFSGTQGRNRIT